MFERERQLRKVMRFAFFSSLVKINQFNEQGSGTASSLDLLNSDTSQ